MTSFSESVERFISNEIHSVEQLEILLLVSENPGKVWTAGEVYDLVKSSIPSVTERLEAFAKRKILKRIDGKVAGYSFAPQHPDQTRVIGEIREEYRERRVRMVQFIYSKVPNAVAEFARAFRIREDD